MDAEHQTQASRRCHTRGHLPLLDPLRRIRLYGMRAFRGKKTPSCQRLFPALTSGRSIPATRVEESPVFALPPCGLRPDVHAETNSHLWHACFPGEPYFSVATSVSAAPIPALLPSKIRSEVSPALLSSMRAPPSCPHTGHGRGVGEEMHVDRRAPAAFRKEEATGCALSWLQPQREQRQESRGKR